MQMGNLLQTLEKQAFAGNVDRVENVEKQDCPQGENSLFCQLCSARRSAKIYPQYGGAFEGVVLWILWIPL